MSAAAVLCGAGTAALVGLSWPPRPAIAGAPPGSPQWVGQQAAARAAGPPASAANPTSTLTPAQLAQMQRSIRNADGTLAGRLYDGSLESGVFASQSFVPEADPVEGSVEVQAGAVIRTEALSQDNQFLGRVVLAAPKVVNAGTIETPDGQALLVGARNFTLMNNDAGTIASLQETNKQYNDTVIASLVVDPDLRGAQVFAGAEDFFTTRGQVADELAQPTPDPDPLQVRVVFLNARNAVTADGRTYAAPLVDAPLFDPDNPAAGRGFSVVNTGLISAPRGNITLRSQKVELAAAASDSFADGVQYGMLHVTTAVNANGTIYADAEALPYVDDGTIGGALQSEPSDLRLASSTVLAMMPDLTRDWDDTTTVAGDAMIGRQPTLPSDDISSAQFRVPVTRLAVERPNATADFQTILDSSQTAGTLVVESDALIVAPSAEVTLVSSRLTANPETGEFGQIEIDPATGERREATPIEANVLIESGAEIDVSGLSDAVLSMASNVVKITRVGALQLADEPLQKNSFLYGSEVYIDRRLTGTRDDGTTWYGTPLFDASGDIESVGRTVSELLITGGDISLSGIVRTEEGSVSGRPRRWRTPASPTSGWARPAPWCASKLERSWHCPTAAACN